jgi:hypothetical protein
MRISRIMPAVLAGSLLAGCAILVPQVSRVEPTPVATTPGGHVFSTVDHYVGVVELGAAAVDATCADPGATWTRAHADARWRLAELYDASDYPSKLLAVRYSIEEAEHLEEFLIDVVRPPESFDAAEFACASETERWAAEIDRQKTACASGPGTCWSRDLAGENPPAPTAPLDVTTYIVQVGGPIDEDYVGVEKLAAAVIAAECAPRTRTWTQDEADAYRALGELFGDSEFPVALSEEANYLGLADTYDAYLVGVPRTPESFPAAERACDFATKRWEAELERQRAACLPGAPSVPACWSRDLLTQ